MIVPLPEPAYRGVPSVTLDQCKAYGDARVRAALEEAIAHIRVKLIGCGRSEIIQELMKRLP